MVWILSTMLVGGLISFCSKRKHLLLMLLSIEFIILGLFFSLFFILSVSNFFFSLIFLTFAACEGALGLGVLVSMSRVFGADYFKVFNFT
uniref:NADH-ubiquinone oxidoreductase chain 4L n=1 Tax=Allacma fusca TaxID=39272 RepID=A0A7D5C2V6_9HEXA|nr:NADH dehydrogenase subunit 4L [Allacma fusca]